MQWGSVLGPTLHGHRTVITSAAYHGQFDNIRLCDLVQESQKFSAQNLLHTRQVSGKEGWTKIYLYIENMHIKNVISSGLFCDTVGLDVKE